MRRLTIATGILVLLTACQRGQESQPIKHSSSSVQTRSRAMSSRERSKASSVASVAVKREAIILQSSTSEKTRLTLHVEIANESGEWERGLMYRDTLEGGMLFIFPEEKERAFWMKNTRIPLDILYFTAIGELVSIQTMLPCVKDPCETYSSNGPAKYALEVNAGYAKQHSIGKEWVMELR